MSQLRPSLLELFLVFFRIGAFTFGGGLAMLPIMKHELCHKRSWMSSDDFLQVVTIGTAFPGLIAVNVAFLQGSRLRGLPGVVLSVLAVILPAFFIMMTIAAFLFQFFALAPLRAFFIGAAAAITAQIAIAALIFLRRLRNDLWGLGVFVAAFLAISIMGQHPVIVVLGAAIVRFLLPSGGAQNK